MALSIPTDLDFLSARLHGRRSRLAEAERLDGLCRLRTVAELARAIFADATAHTAVDLQRRLVVETVEELDEIAANVTGHAAEFLAWLGVRYQMENLKVLARGFSSGMGADDIRPHLIPLPGRLALRFEPFLSAGSVEAFASLIPAETLYKSVALLAVGPYTQNPKPFFIEAALDHGYLSHLAALAGPLSSEDRAFVLTIVRQEVETFHMMLAARGRFHYQLSAETLAPFRVRGAGIPSDRFLKMIRASDLGHLAALAAGHAINAASASWQGATESPRGEDVAILEALAWNRYWRVANGTFRRSHMGLGAVVAFTGIRRVELANLITLSEGIRMGLAPEVIRRRLIPRTLLESTRV